ncbi:MAG: type II toxin-antitoxin system VapC family toxin [Candidatus Micrarchaeota archaeon]|nr:type II toxin-antitoxin system VapC family toxin [Candidatus Micrarchaeota archaeon]MDE1859437.1 type II toxin-antitoxin system VapC family toxin [Candidatus Micrarchaeota archaeon]
MIIVDASAIVKLVVKEENSSKAIAEIEGAINRGEVIVSADIALAETLSAIWKHHKILKDISLNELNDKIDVALLIWDRIVKIDTRPLAHKAMEVALANNLTTYDSLYVAACKANNAPLLTFDDGIINRADELDIQLL